MIYMFTLIRMGKDRKDIDKDWILCNIYTVNTIWGIRKENSSIISLWFLKVLHHANLITSSHILSLAIYIYKTVPFYQYCFSCFHKVLISIATLDWIGIIRFIHCQIFIMRKLKSWSWHQICDTSFLYINIWILC